VNPRVVPRRLPSSLEEFREDGDYAPLESRNLSVVRDFFRWAARERGLAGDPTNTDRLAAPARHRTAGAQPGRRAPARARTGRPPRPDSAPPLGPARPAKERAPPHPVPPHRPRACVAAHAREGALCQVGECAVAGRLVPAPCNRWLQAGCSRRSFAPFPQTAQSAVEMLIIQCPQNAEFSWSEALAQDVHLP
jgi:hypothetical protein